MKGEEKPLGFPRGIDGDSCLGHPLLQGLELAAAEGLFVINGLGEEKTPLLKEFGHHALGLGEEMVGERVVQGADGGLGAGLVDGEIAGQVLGGEGRARGEAGQPTKEFFQGHSIRRAWGLDRYVAGAKSHKHELLSVENHPGQAFASFFFSQALYILLELFDSLGARLEG